MNSTTPTTSFTQFSQLSLSPAILRALQEEGYTQPTPIQSAAIPPAMSGRDILGCAETGTGKTCAFALPILERMLAAHPRGTRATPHQPTALILAPTRELAAQIAESFHNYGRHTGLSATAIFGGVSQHSQTNALRRGVDVLIATPGRLIDLLQQREVSLSRVRFFVLDEADRMLDMGFIQPIRRIGSLVPADRQTMLFSATMPQEILQLANSFLRDPVRISVAPPAGVKKLITQCVYHVSRAEKPQLLEFVIGSANPERALVFTKTKRGADVVCKRLRHAGIPADSIHGDKAQNRRIRALDAFRSGECQVLVATDVAARGIDVDGIDYVINYEIPNIPESYVHRIGRTGRAGAEGIAIAFCEPGERAYLRDIEKVMGMKIPVITPDAAAGRVDSTEPQKAEAALADAPIRSHPDTVKPHAPSHRRTHPPRADRSHGSSRDARDARESRHPKSRTPGHAPKHGPRNAPAQHPSHKPAQNSPRFAKPAHGPSTHAPKADPRRENSRDSEFRGGNAGGGSKGGHSHRAGGGQHNRNNHSSNRPSPYAGRG